MSIRQRMYPEPDQGARMLVHTQHAREVFNIGLEQQKMWVRGQSARINLATQMRELTGARAEFGWLRDGSTVVQQAALRDLDRAFTNFFSGRARFPRFRSRRDPRQTFVVRDVLVRRINRKVGVALVPKVGWVRFRLTRTLTDVATATSARVTFHNNCWHIAFTTPPPPKIVAGTGARVGIDRGVTNTIATSDGAFAHAPTLTVGEQKRFVALQRQAARQRSHARHQPPDPVTGRRARSARRERTDRSLARLRRRLNDRRTNWIEETTTTLARTYDLVVLEDLKTTNMTRRVAARPNPDQPGTFLPNGGAAKTALNRVILASCWARFATRLATKTVVVAINPRYTSQTCHACGHVAPENRESQAVFRCVKCGHTGHADTNAAHNILARGLNTTPNPVTPGARTHQPHPPRACRVNHPDAA